MGHSKRVSIFVQIMFTGLASTLQCIKYDIKGKLRSIIAKFFLSYLLCDKKYLTKPCGCGYHRIVKKICL